MKKVVLISNIPTPYRNKVYELVANHKKIDLTVVFCAKIEKNRKWDLDFLNYPHMFLSKRNGFIHNNLNVLWKLKKINPDIVITSGFNPTMIYAFLYSLISGKKHIPFTDGTIKSESNLTILHSIIRKFVYKHSYSYIAASNQSINLYKSYDINSSKIFKSVLAVDNKKYKSLSHLVEYDMLFSGQFIKRKNPLFFVELFKKLKSFHPNLKAVMLGDGEMFDQVREIVNKESLNIDLPGFIQQEKLPYYFSKSKLFFFPTLSDPWGLVVNEAMATGLPILTSSNPGVVNEVVIDNFNGFVFNDFNLKNWTTKTNQLLNDESLYLKFSNNSKEIIKTYNFKESSLGIINSILK